MIARERPRGPGRRGVAPGALLRALDEGRTCERPQAAGVGRRGGRLHRIFSPSPVLTARHRPTQTIVPSAAIPTGPPWPDAKTVGVSLQPDFAHFITCPATVLAGAVSASPIVRLTRSSSSWAIQVSAPSTSRWLAKDVSSPNASAGADRPGVRQRVPVSLGATRHEDQRAQHTRFRNGAPATPS
jgi:hypothetical protein